MELVKRLYLIDGLSSIAIGEKLGTTGMTIRRRLHAGGVVRTAQDNHLQRNSHWNGGSYVDGDGYVQVMRKGHVRADHQGYVNRSILVWEEANGMSFPEDKVPHHKNLIRNDDRPENIEPLTDVDHAELHAELRRTAVKC